jgi:hypothetical protein
MLRIVAAVVAVSALALSYLLAYRLAADTQPLDRFGTVAKADAVADEHLRNGLALEQQARLGDAQLAYGQALAADDAAVRSLAERALERTRRKQTDGLPPWIGLRWDEIHALLTAGRPVFVIVITIAVLDLVWRRKGIAIDLFPVYGIADPAAAAAFRTYLHAALQDHQRVLSSRSFQLLGGVPTADFLVQSPQAGDLLGRALEGAKSGELTSVVAFSIRELLQFLRSYRDRPAYVLTGQVRCGPDDTFVHAELRGIVSPLAIFESASSREYPGGAAAPAATPVVNTALVLDGRAIVAEELRGSHSALAQAASVLASKLWYGLSAAARSDLRPVSWLTFFRIVRASIGPR